MKKQRKTSEYPTVETEGSGETEQAAASAAGAEAAAETSGHGAGSGTQGASEENGAGEELPPATRQGMHTNT
jgi:hypothetical protein